MAAPSPVQGSPPATHGTSRLELAPPLVSAAQYYEHHSSSVVRAASSSTLGSRSDPVPVSASASGLKNAGRSIRRCFKLPYSLLGPAAQSILWPTDTIYFRYRELPAVRQALRSGGAKDRHHKPKPKPRGSDEIRRTHQGRANTLNCGTCVVDYLLFFLVEYVYIGLILYYRFVAFSRLYDAFRDRFHLDPNRKYALAAMALADTGLEYVSQSMFGMTHNQFLWRVPKFIRRQRAQWRVDNGLDRTLPAAADEETKHSHLRSYITWRNLQAEPLTDPLDDFFEYFVGVPKRFVYPAEESPKCHYWRFHPYDFKNESSSLGRVFDKANLIVRLGREPNVASSHPTSRLRLSNLRAQAREDDRKIDLLVKEYIKLLEEGRLMPGNEHDSSIRALNLEDEEFIQAGGWEDKTFFVEIKDVFDGLEEDFITETEETPESSRSSATKSDEESDDSDDSDSDDSDDSDEVSNKESGEESDDDLDWSDDGSDDSDEEFHDATNEGSEAGSNENSNRGTGNGSGNGLEDGADSDQDKGINVHCYKCYGSRTQLCPYYEERDDFKWCVECRLSADAAGWTWQPVPKREDGFSTGLDNGVDGQDEFQATEDQETKSEVNESQETNEERPVSLSDVSVDSGSFEADDEEYFLVDNLQVWEQHEQQAQHRLRVRWPWFRS